MNALRATWDTLVGLIFDDPGVLFGSLGSLVLTLAVASMGQHGLAGVVLVVGVLLSVSYSLWREPAR